MSGSASINSPETGATSDAPTGAQLLVRALEDQGVETIFGYPGGAIMPVYDALTGASFKHILTRHEQGAALAADGYARVSGKVGVCLATSGPGVTNLITGIANAYLDSVPMVAIGGQVATNMVGTDAFQEIDAFGITMPIVKHSFFLRDAADIPAVIAEAFEIASSGRPGPVYIDLPKDITIDRPGKIRYYQKHLQPRQTDTLVMLAEAERLILQSKKPLLYVGGGVVMAGAVEALRSFAARTRIPVVATLKGLGAIPTDNPSCLGMIGMHGLKAANLAVQDCDLLIVVGARFDDRATGKLAEFAPHARVIHMDVDPAEVGKLRKADIALHGHLATTLEALRPRPVMIDGWRAWCMKNKKKHAWKYNAPGKGIYAPAFLKQLTERVDEKLIVTCDVGQHQMWVAQHCRFARPEAHLTSGGLGTMGYGIPAGIGAKFARPDATVVTVTGDGSIMMNIQELATLKRYDINLKIVVFDNSALGLVRQWQELFFEGNYSEVDLSDNPDFANLAKAFGIDGFTIAERSEIPGAFDRLFETEGPVLLHVKINPKENLWPLVPPGKSNSHMMEGIA